MGGGFSSGNHTQFSEFNSFADPEALAILLKRKIPIRIIDLDACRRVTIAEDDVLRLKRVPGDRAALLADLLGGYLDIARAKGRSRMAIYDPVAAAALIQPDSFEFISASVEVQLHDTEMRGRTIANREIQAAPNTEIVQTVDAEGVRSLFRAAMEGSHV